MNVAARARERERGMPRAGSHSAQPLMARGAAAAGQSATPGLQYTLLPTHTHTHTPLAPLGLPVFRCLMRAGRGQRGRGRRRRRSERGNRPPPPPRRRDLERSSPPDAPMAPPALMGSRLLMTAPKLLPVVRTGAAVRHSRGIATVSELHLSAATAAAAAAAPNRGPIRRGRSRHWEGVPWPAHRRRRGRCRRHGRANRKGCRNGSSRRRRSFACAGCRSTGVSSAAASSCGCC